MSADCKVRIYKTNVRPVLTYGSETRAETAYNQKLLRKIEMKSIIAVHGKTLRDYIRLNQLSNTTNLWWIDVYYIVINYMFRRLWPSSG